jgi:hypothetical protein
VRQAAVSDAAGESSFVRVAGDAAWSGLREYEQIGGAAKETITVPTVRLDDDLPPGYVPALIKIDVNGAERQVLEGAIGTLSEHKPVVLFEHGRAAGAYDTTAEMIFELLTVRSGLRLFDLTGEGPLDRAGFRECARTRWNFLARSGE